MPGDAGGAPRRRERKVVSVLFCDLVGFTAQAETMDPEDVEALLRPYHDRVRAELERHGGTVEKFIGDAVMALFGAPVAHEDDPERAVRAALAIREWAEERSIELRIGITTGEALVWLDASPSVGEGMASGDVVNTAARLQAAAPVNGVLVDESTRRATQGQIEFRDAPPVEAKGKSAPIAASEAVAARSRFGPDVTQRVAAELVGRQREVAMLRDAFARATHDRTPQLVTLIGVPGIGKSRLVRELGEIAEADTRLVSWRQGRCLAYGEGVAYWALADIVKAEAGVMEGDPETTVATKIESSVRGLVTDARDAAWVEEHLRPLVGLETDGGIGGDRGAEAEAAWRRYIEALGERGPLVLVFEDIHWADDGLLGFVDGLVDWLTDVPVLVVGTARPELLERRPGWGGGKLNAVTVGLTPLADDETALLVAQVLERALIPAEVQRAILDRAGGNPLYAEQFAELYRERGEVEDAPMPETLQGLVAARLDGLAPDEKALLQAGAVMGKIFWTGSLAGTPGIGDRLHGLERKGFVQRQRRSSVEGDSEWSFAHLVLRDVAYAQIPRGERSAKHRAAAEWIAELGRPEDHAELLAHHWTLARDLALASGHDATDLDEPVRMALRSAGVRAFGIHAHRAAATHYAGALALWPADGERPALQLLLGRALMLADDTAAVDVLGEASHGLSELGDADGAAEAEIAIARISWERGNNDEAELHYARAEALTKDRASPAAAEVMAALARAKALAAADDHGRALAERALALADQFDLDEVRVHALATIGMSKGSNGDVSGIADLEKALAIAVERNLYPASSIANNLGVELLYGLELARAAAYFREAARLSQRIGDAGGERWARAQNVFDPYLFGDWDEAVRNADGFIAECEAGSPHYLETHVRTNRARIRFARGEVDGALTDHRRAIEVARGASDPQVMIPVLSRAAVTFEELGLLDEAADLTREVAEVAQLHPGEAVLPLVEGTLMTRAAEPYKAAFEAALARSGRPKLAAIGRACLDRDFATAADMWAEAGSPTWEAQLRMLAADELLATGNEAEARDQADRALAFYRTVRATRYVTQLEARFDQRASA
jgi:class 3 adenylate cyclase/tetratricopeptide (TPR) repeat protein